MREFLFLLIDILVTLARLCWPGGKSAILAEHLLLRQQLIIVRRSQNRAPTLKPWDRFVFAFMTLFVKSSRLPKLSLILAHSTILRLHKALVHRKYSRLFSNLKGKPGPKGPSTELIKLIVEIKQKNPKYGCPRIAMLASELLGIPISESMVRRILRKHYYLAPGAQGPSWLNQIGTEKDRLWSIDFFRCESILLRSYWVMLVMDHFSRQIVGVTVHRGPLIGENICQMFAKIVAQKKLPKYLSTDHDPLFRYLQWQANLRVLEINEIKTVSEIPTSHPFIERLIGTTRREYLDEILFWNTHDLQRKLNQFSEYYNSARVHYSLDGKTPASKYENIGIEKINLKNYCWKTFCNGKFSIPAAA